MTLISPFVGRILDWYQKNQPQNFTAETDPGVLSVQKIYHYLHYFNFPTTVMGDSFRNLNQIRALAGCDYLTISPALLQELQNSADNLPRKLSPQDPPQNLTKLSLDEKTFRWLLNENAMATDKLSEAFACSAPTCKNSKSN